MNNIVTPFEGNEGVTRERFNRMLGEINNSVGAPGGIASTDSDGKIAQRMEHSHLDNVPSFALSEDVPASATAAINTQKDKPGGIAGYDWAVGELAGKALKAGSIKTAVNISPATTGFGTLAEYLHNCYKEGYRGVNAAISSFSDMPLQDWGFGVFASVGEGGYVWNVELFRSLSPERWFRQLNAESGDWFFYHWVPYALAAPSPEFDLPLVAGVTALLKSTAHKNQFGDITIKASLLLPNGNAGEIHACTLPEGYRPTADTELPITLQDQNLAGYAGTAKVSATTGNVVIQRHTAGFLKAFFNWTF